MLAQPGDLTPGLKRSLRVGVPQRMEGALLSGRPLALDACALHRRVEHLPRQNPMRHVAATPLAREHELVLLAAAALPPPLAEQLDEVLGQADRAPLAILRLAQSAGRVALADVNLILGEIDIAPGQRDELPFAHPGLEREFEQDAMDAIGELGEETRQLLVLEVVGFLPLWPRLCLGPKLPDGRYEFTVFSLGRSSPSSQSRPQFSKRTLGTG